MQKTFKYHAIVFMLITLCGCVAPVIHQTASGKVETTIQGVNKAVVKERLVNEMINRGYSVTKSDDVTLVFDRISNDPYASMFYGSQYNSTPSSRVTYNILQNGKAVRVVADCAIITNPSSPYEQRSDMNSSPGSLDIQKVLDGLKSKMQQRKKA